MRALSRTFISGLLAALPLIITVVVTVWLVSFFADYIGPNSRFGSFIASLGFGVTASNVAPYLAGVAVILIAIYLLGLLVETRLGGWLSRVFEGAVENIPIISSVYDLSKRFTSIVDQKGDGNLSGMSPVWCFFGGEPGAAVLALLASPKPVIIGKDQYLGVLIPSAPVPIGGALIYVPASWVKPAEDGVEHVMSVYVSMGVTPPKDAPR